jgi:hypothetical protein
MKAMHSFNMLGTRTNLCSNAVSHHKKTRVIGHTTVRTRNSHLLHILKNFETYTMHAIIKTLSTLTNYMHQSCKSQSNCINSPPKYFGLTRLSSRSYVHVTAGRKLRIRIWKCTTQVGQIHINDMKGKFWCFADCASQYNLSNWPIPLSTCTLGGHLQSVKIPDSALIQFDLLMMSNSARNMQRNVMNLL